MSYIPIYTIAEEAEIDRLLEEAHRLGNTLERQQYSNTPHLTRKVRAELLAKLHELNAILDKRNPLTPINF